MLNYYETNLYLYWGSFSEISHLFPKPKQCFIWKVNYCHCYLCSPYLRSKGNIDRIKTSPPLSASNIEGTF